jgi:hypothetical protein
VRGSVFDDAGGLELLRLPLLPDRGVAEALGDGLLRPLLLFSAFATGGDVTWSPLPPPTIEERASQTLVRRRVHSIARIALTPAQLEALGL